MAKLQSHKELDVFQLAFGAATKLFELTKLFPKEEKYSLTDQIRRSSRSVCANIAEAFRKRKYPAYFTAKLFDSEGEAAETLVWLDFAKSSEYMTDEDYENLVETYDCIIRKIVTMRQSPEKWKL